MTIVYVRNFYNEGIICIKPTKLSKDLTITPSSAYNEGLHMLKGSITDNTQFTNNTNEQPVNFADENYGYITINYSHVNNSITFYSLLTPKYTQVDNVPPAPQTRYNLFPQQINFTAEIISDGISPPLQSDASVHIVKDTSSDFPFQPTIFTYNNDTTSETTSPNLSQMSYDASNSALTQVLVGKSVII